MALKLESALYATRTPGDLAKRTCSDSEAILAWATDYGKRGTKELKENGYKPAILVTTSREALRAAWDLAHEVNEVPANTEYLRLSKTGRIVHCDGFVLPMDSADEDEGEVRRLLDPPAPEPWETALVPAEIPEAGE